MQVSASWAGAWWMLVFIAALVLVAQVPPRRLAEVKEGASHARTRHRRQGHAARY